MPIKRGMDKDNVAHAHTHTHTHTLEISHKKNEILQFETTWMDLEGIIFREIS